MRLMAIIFLIFGCMSCAQDPEKNETTQVTFNFNVPRTSEGDLHGWGGTPPVSKDDIECVGIFASYPEDSTKGTCYSPDGTAILTVSKMLGTFSPSSRQSASFNSGPARTFYLIGFQSTSGVCSSFSNLNKNDLSRPYLLGQSTLNLDGPTATVNLSGAISTAQEFDECNGGPFEISQDGVYGNGELGDYSYTSGTTYLDTTTYGIRYAKIIEIDTSVGNIVTVDPGDAANFSNNDLVMWHVSAYGNTVSNCGVTTTRNVGEYDFARIVSINGDILTLDKVVRGVGDTTINDTTAGTLRSTSNTKGSNWCKIQLVKVPEFRNLTISSGAILTIYTSYDSMTGKGGVMPFAVSGILNLDGGVIHANERGFQGFAGITYGGNGWNGKASTSPYNGGGFFGTSTYGGGGGGGRFKNGGAGGGNSASEGLGYTCGTGIPCLILGGAGGANSSSLAGGAGGGGIVLLAYEINLDSASSMSANGGSGINGIASVSGGSGGGAAGNILIKANNIFGSSLSFEVNGGAGGSGSGSDGGGGGAGGSVGVHTCSSYSLGTVTSSGGAGGTGTTNAGDPGQTATGSQAGSHTSGLCD